MTRLLSISAFLMALGMWVYVLRDTPQEQPELHSAEPFPESKHIDTLLVHRIVKPVILYTEGGTGDPKPCLADSIACPQRLAEIPCAIAADTTPAESVLHPDTSGLRQDWQCIKEELFAAYEQREPTFEEYQLICERLRKSQEMLARQYSLDRTYIEQHCR